ncbi:hypothetical protein H1C71_027074 [Ictidomys tridecemlineatus]|nr:hypothetical protein H1C71_027074 [Ictidomys tridecemlineatus]
MLATGEGSSRCSPAGLCMSWSLSRDAAGCHSACRGQACLGSWLELHVAHTLCAPPSSAAEHPVLACPPTSHTFVCPKPEVPLWQMRQLRPHRHRPCLMCLISEHPLNSHALCFKLP